MSIKVSVIIPVYNAENTVEKCVKSLFAGTYKNIEIILINDASKDNSFAVCKKIEMFSDDIVLLDNDVNHGVSYTRNRGLQAASGDLIMFTDSDDWVEPNYIEFMVDFYNHNQDKLVVCGYVNHDEVKNGRTDIYAWKDFDTTQSVLMKESLMHLYKNCLLQQLWNKVFVRKIIEENKIRFDENISIGEDFRFILQYLKAAHIEEILECNYPLYHYSRDNQNSLMMKYGREKIEEPLYNFRLLYELMGYSSEEVEAFVAKQKEDIMFQYGYALMHNGNLSDKEIQEIMKESIGTGWEKSYKANKKLLMKEKISKLLHRN